MKVLFVLPDAYPAGSASASLLQRLALGLRENRVACEVLCFEKKGGQPEVWRNDPMGIPYFGLRFTGNYLNKLSRVPVLSRLLAMEVQRGIREREVTHILLFDAHWVLYHNVISVCRRERMPVVAYLVEWWRFAPAPFRNHYYGQVLFHRLSISKLSGLIGISTPFLKLAKARKLPGMLLPVPCPPELDSPAVSQTSSPKPNSFTFFYTGVLLRRDMPDVMLHAMRQLAQQGVGIRLVISGRSNLNRHGRAFVRAVSADTKLKKCVSLAGYLPDQEFRSQRANADAYLLLHEDSWESRACFPTRLSEYLCCGKPVIVSGVGDIPLYLRDGKDAVVLPPNNQAEALAGAMLRLAGDPTKASSLGLAGRQRALEVFSRGKLGGEVKRFLGQMPVKGRHVTQPGHFE